MIAPIFYWKNVNWLHLIFQSIDEQKRDLWKVVMICGLIVKHRDAKKQWTNKKSLREIVYRGNVSIYVWTVLKN